MSCQKIDGKWKGYFQYQHWAFNFLMIERNGTISSSGTINENASIKLTGTVNNKNISIIFETKRHKYNFTGRIISNSEIKGDLNGYSLTFTKID